MAVTVSQCLCGEVVDVVHICYIAQIQVHFLILYRLQFYLKIVIAALSLYLNKINTEVVRAAYHNWFILTSAVIGLHHTSTCNIY